MSYAYGDSYDFGDLADYGEWNPIWGFMAGGALTGAAITTLKALGHHWPTPAKHAGLIGGGIGLLGSAILMIPHRTRRAGFLAAASSVLVSLPEILRALLLVPRGLGDYDEMGYYASEFAAPNQPALEIMAPPPMFGVPPIPPVAILQGAPQMGYTTAEFAGANGWA